MIPSREHSQVNPFPSMKTPQEKRPDHMTDSPRLPEPFSSKTSRIPCPFHSLHLIDENEGVTVHEGDENSKNLRGTQPFQSSDQLREGGGGVEQNDGEDT